MNFDLNDEKATDVLIWWVEGSDGSIDFREKEAVKKVLHDMNYSMETYYEESLMRISALSTEHIKELIDKAIEYGSQNFSDHQKEKVVALLYAVAESNDNITEGQKEKIDKIRSSFGIEDLKLWEKE